MKAIRRELSRISKWLALAPVESPSRQRFTALALAVCAGVVACGSSSPSGQSGGGASSSVGGASPSGGGGTGNGAGTGGSAGNVAAAGASAVSGSDTGGTAGATAGGAGGTTEGGATSLGGSAAGSATGGAGGGSNGGTRVLIYCVTTGFRHGSIPAAAGALAAAIQKLALSAVLVGCGNDNQPDPTKLTSAALAQDAAVVLLANSGEPFGYPATAEIQNLVDYVQRGGALVAIEDADHCYDGAFNGHPASDAYVNLIGNDFVGHPGGVAPATCTPVGDNASVSQLAPTFTTTDEIYETTKFRAENQVVLSCKSSGDTVVRPVSYVRQEGAGRVFFTALGHLDESWTKPLDGALANTRLVEDHVMPGMVWAMGR